MAKCRERDWLICEECEKHGHIVLADGFVGLTFAWQEYGFQVINEGLAYERFTSTEAMRMSKELKLSKLPVKFEKVDPQFAWKAHLYNLLRADPEGYVVEIEGDFNNQVHIYLQAPPEESMPRDFVEQVKKKMKSFRQ